MNVSRKLHGWFAFLSALVILGASMATVIAAPPTASPQAGGDVVVSDKQPAAGTDPFAVPNGSPEELLVFIEKVAHPQKQFASQDEMRAYFNRASVSIGTAADKVLAASSNATDQQTIDAIEWKVESLRIKGELGDETANKQTETFLAGLKYEGRAAVTDAILKIRQNFQLIQFQMQLANKLRVWPTLSAAEHAEIIGQIGTMVKLGGATPEKFGMLIEIADAIGDHGDGSLAGKMLDDVLPLFRNSKDEDIQHDLPLLEGIARRLNLPGHKLELAGTYLDGKPLDWEAYRGKVVLVDFWATWCGPCRAEVPNVLENYRKYHDKGFDVLGISLDEKRSDVEQYMRDSGVPWRTTFYAPTDPQHKQPPMALKYGVTGIPRCILVDQQGNVVNLNARGKVLANELQKLLGGPPAAANSALQSSDEEKTAEAN